MKSIEDELAGPYGALDKALDRIEKTFTKFVHGMSPEQRDAAVSFLVGRVQSTAEAMQRAGQSRTPFSFAAAQRAPQAQQLVTIRPDPTSSPVTPYSDGVSLPIESVRPRGYERNTPLAPHQLPPRPIGRIADASLDPDAGEVLVAPPIVSPLVRNLDPGTGYVNPRDDKGDLV